MSDSPAGKGDTPRPGNWRAYHAGYERVFNRPCNKCGEPQPEARGGTCHRECSNCRHPYPHGDCSD